MALLGPGVRKVDMHACQRPGWNHLLKHFHGIVLNDPYVRQPRFIDALQHGAHAGIEDFYAQKAILGPCRGDLLCGLAHAKADLEYGGGYAAERLPEIELSGLKGYGPQGHEPIQRLTLARRYM